MIASVLAAGLVLGLCDLHVVSGKCRFRQGQHDAIFVTTCEARCWNIKEKQSCIRSCIQKGVQKPANCPVSINPTLSPFASVCMETCWKDSQCPGLYKCCRHHCGVTCQYPEGLQAVQDVPPIPTDVTVKERRRKKSVVIEWKPGEYLPKGNILYVVEERHYTGKHLIDDRMSEWTACLRTSKPSIKHVVKPGRWYHFRVAAINENGTRGFSERSFNFIFSAGPRPPKAPQDVSVGPLWAVNGTLNAELRWVAPQSDLPIQRYNVFWSRRLRGATALDSVLVHHQSVPKDQTKFLLQKLQQNSSYFLQIQAIVHYGRDRIKGEKSGLVLNTTEFIKLNNTLGRELFPPNRIEGLDLKKPVWTQGDLQTRLIWRSKKDSKYNVSWWTSSCDGAETEHTKLTATTRGSHFDLYNLQFKCRYKVTIREVPQRGAKPIQDTSLTFSTPSCEDVKLRNRRAKCIK